MNKSLDEIITYRRSIRVFKAEFPPIEDIKKIIRAGLLAPYAAAAVGDAKNFRKFLIIRKDGKTIQKIAPLVKREAELRFEALKNNIRKNPSLVKNIFFIPKKTGDCEKSRCSWSRDCSLLYYYS